LRGRRGKMLKCIQGKMLTGPEEEKKKKKNKK
jgi:hypothetical protein